MQERHNLAQLRTLLEDPTHRRQRIVLTSHANPDGDALGSSLALAHLFSEMGHTVSVIMPTELPDFLSWMPLFNIVVVYEDRPEIARRLLQDADIIFCLDYNSPSRVGDMSDALTQAQGFKVMIDHHLEPQNFTQAHYWRTSSSSTCELVYEWVRDEGWLDKMPADGLDCLYVGLLTDTGGFRHATSANLFRIVADLLERDVDNNYLCDLVFNTYSIKRFRLLTHATSQGMEILDDVGIGIITLTKQDHDHFDIRRGDAEGIANFALSIKELLAAVLVSERKDGTIKISMRSKQDFSVQAICKAHFGGGGHRNASGGSSTLPLADTLQKLKTTLTEAAQAYRKAKSE